MTPVNLAVLVAGTLALLALGAALWVAGDIEAIDPPKEKTMPRHTETDYTRPTDKVMVATTAGTAAAAIGTLAMYVLKVYAHVDVPDPVNVAVVTLLTLVLTLASGYLTPENHPAPSAVETVHERGLR